MEGAKVTEGEVKEGKSKDQQPKFKYNEIG